MIKLYHLPNVITLFRMALVPVFILVLEAQDYVLALTIFVVAGLSDGLDGFIAKRYNLVTRLGAILDPMADKILLVSTYVMLAVLDHLPFWLVLTVGFRDLLIIGGYLIYTSLIGEVNVRPTYLSKCNTVLQIVLVIIILIQEAALLPLQPIVDYGIYAVLVTTVASGLHYLWICTKRYPEATSRSDQYQD